MAPLPLCRRCGKTAWVHGLRGKYMFCDVDRMVVDGRGDFDRWVVDAVRHTLGKPELK